MSATPASGLEQRVKLAEERTKSALAEMTRMEIHGDPISPQYREAWNAWSNAELELLALRRLAAREGK